MDMSDQQTAQVSMADYQALVKRVEELDRIVHGQRAPMETAPKSSVADIRAFIEELQSKYAQYPSFTETLRAERRHEFEREETRLRTRQLRHTRSSAKTKREKHASPNSSCKHKTIR